MKGNSPSWLLRIILLCGGGGATLGLFFVWSLPVALLVISVALPVCFVWCSKRVLLCAISVASFSFFWWHSDHVASSWSALPEMQSNLLVADVVSEPVSRDSFQRVTLRPIQCSHECPGVLVSGTLPSFLNIRMGDRLSLLCPLERPLSASSSPGEFLMVLAKDGVGYECRFPRDARVSGTSDDWKLTIFGVIQNSMERGIDAAIPSPESGLVAGILVGGSGRLPKYIQEQFSRVGLSHIVAVSGYNISLVAASFFPVLLVLGFSRRNMLWILLCGIGFFTLLVGAPASAVRAALMAGAVLCATRFGRIADPLNSVLLAGIAMIAMNPLLLRYDIGFQLSFAATIGILFVSPALLLSLKIKDIIATTLSAELFTLPIILFHFHAFPILSILANVFVLPLIPIDMLFGALAAFSGIFPEFFAPWIGFPAYCVSHVILGTVRFISDLRIALIPVESFGVTALCLSIAIIGILGGFLYRRFSEMRKL